ncbi:hypothetical protein [Hymenobacter koreensis]|uniref:DUF2971 domain-containing protein n=1 Tax=Hymenobacter koreensis TaxID=1084523 RepID=A0ABP8IZH3_9BACT
MTKKPIKRCYYGPESVFNFGKYKGENLVFVSGLHPTYMDFCCSKVPYFCMSRQVLIYLNNVMNYDISSDALKMISVKNSTVINQDIASWFRELELYQVNNEGDNIPLLCLPYYKELPVLGESKSLRERIASGVNNRSNHPEHNVEVFCFLIRNNDFPQIGEWINSTKNGLGVVDYGYWSRGCSTYFDEGLIVSHSREVMFIELSMSKEYCGLLLLLDYSGSEFDPNNKIIVTNSVKHKYKVQQYKKPVFVSADKFYSNKNIDIHKSNGNDAMYLQYYKPHTFLREYFWLNTLLMNIDNKHFAALGLDKFYIYSNPNRDFWYSSSNEMFKIRIGDDKIRSICSSIPCYQDKNLAKILDEAREEIARRCFFWSQGMIEDYSID